MASICLAGSHRSLPGLGLPLLPLHFILTLDSSYFNGTGSSVFFSTSRQLLGFALEQLHLSDRLFDVNN